MGFAIPLVKKQSGFQPTIEPTGFQPVVVQCLIVGSKIPRLQATTSSTSDTAWHRASRGTTWVVAKAGEIMGFAIPLVKKQSGFQPTIEPTGFQPVVVQFVARNLANPIGKGERLTAPAVARPARGDGQVELDPRLREVEQVIPVNVPGQDAYRPHGCSSLTRICQGGYGTLAPAT
jgi:hypothetical protein